MEALTSSRLQELAWTKHGFRGPLGTATGNADSAIAGLLPAEIDAVLPTPDANVMLALLDKLASSVAEHATPLLMPYNRIAVRLVTIDSACA